MPLQVLVVEFPPSACCFSRHQGFPCLLTEECLQLLPLFFPDGCLGTHRPGPGSDGSLCLVTSKSLLAPFEERYIAGTSGGKPHGDTVMGCNVTSVTSSFLSPCHTLTPARALLLAFLSGLSQPCKQLGPSPLAALSYRDLKSFFPVERRRFPAASLLPEAFP